MIARILHRGMIDQQGLLHVGDIIKEANGKEVGDDPRVLQEMLQEASGSVVLKILPSYQEPHPPRQVPSTAEYTTCDRILLCVGWPWPHLHLVFTSILSELVTNGRH